MAARRASTMTAPAELAARGRHRAEVDDPATRRLARASGAGVVVAALAVLAAATVTAALVLRTGGGCTDCTPLGRGTLTVIALLVGWGAGVPLLRYGARRWREHSPPR